MEPATTTVITVLDSLLIHASATRIVQRTTAELHAGTSAVSTATYTVAEITGLPAATYTHIGHTTVCTTPSTVLGKYGRCVWLIVVY